MGRKFIPLPEPTARGTENYHARVACQSSFFLSAQSVAALRATYFGNRAHEQVEEQVEIRLPVGCQSTDSEGLTQSEPGAVATGQTGLIKIRITGNTSEDRPTSPGFALNRNSSEFGPVATAPGSDLAG